MANVLYMVWWEGLRKNGILDNQVYRLLETITSESNHRVSLLSGGAFWRGRLLGRLQSWFPSWSVLSGRGRTFENTAALRERLTNHGVDVIFRQTAACPDSVYLPGWSLLLLSCSNLWFLHDLTRRLSIDIVHCRSYYPAWLAVLSRLLFGDRYRIILDTRGLLPDEGVATGRFRADGFSYRLWKQVEAVLMRRADRVVNVSETFSDCLAKQYPSASLQTIYAAVDLRAFEQALSGRDGAVTAGPFRASAERVLVYLGSISESGWHSVAYLARLFHSFQGRFNDAVLLVITAASGHDALRVALAACGVDPARLRFCSASSIEEVASLLCQATYAALPFREIRNESDRRVGMTMISSKMEEYLAAGIPVLCNQNIGGAARLVREHGVGYAVDLDGGDTNSVTWADPDADPAWRHRCRIAARRFALPLIAARYTDLYRELSSR